MSEKLCGIVSDVCVTGHGGDADVVVMPGKVRMRFGFDLEHLGLVRRAWSRDAPVHLLLDDREIVGGVL